MNTGTQPSDEKTWYRLPRSFWVFLTASGLFSFGMFIYVLLYNLYLLDLGHAEDFIGWVASATLAGNLAGTLVTVLMNRRLGLKGSVIVFFGGMAVVSALRALMTGAMALLGFAFLTGLLFAVWAISLAAVIAQVTTEGQRTAGFSVYLAASIGVGVIADPVGGWLPQWLGTLFGAVGPTESKRWALLAASGIIGLALLPAIRLRLPRLGDARPLAFPRGPFVFRFLLAVVVLNLATAAFNPFANAYFSQYLGMSTQQIGLVFSGGQIAQVLAIVVSPLILRRLDLIRGVAAMEIAAGISIGVLALGQPGMGAALGYAGYMAFQWMDEPAMESLLMSRVQSHERSGAAAMMYFAIFSAGAVTAPVAGKAITSLGYPWVMGVSGVLLVLGGTLFAVLLVGLKRD